MTKYSQWLKQSLTLHPGVNDVTFSNARPNTFFVINSNNNYLYFSMSGIPSSSRYDYRVKPNGIDAFGRPLAVGILSVYNPADSDIVIELYSDDQPFDMSLLKAINMDLDDDQINRLKFDGIVKGWQTLDRVHTVLDNMDDITDALDALDATVTQQADMLADTLSSLHHVTCRAGILSFADSQTAHITGDITGIAYINNDTDKPITVSADGSIYPLYAGERLTDIRGVHTDDITITLDEVTDSSTIRYAVYERGQADGNHS